MLAFVRPQHAVRALLVVLAANLWLSPLLAVAAGLAVLLLPLGWACAAILGAYLLALGLDAETVALSPFGPSQSGRFYGINNLLETMLLAPALVGAAVLGRAGILVAALAFVTIGGNRFGADGGGIVVLAAGYLVLWLRLRGERLTWRRRGWSQQAPWRSHSRCSASTRRPEARATSPTRSATARPRSPATSPTGSSSRFGARLRAPERSSSCSARSRSSPHSPFVPPGTPCSMRFSSAIAVSVVVNDTPGDVLGAGAAIAIALARHTPRHGWLSSESMRRAALLLALLALSAGLAGCGGGQEASPTPETIIGTLPEATTAEEPSSTVEGDASNGAQIFASAGCGGCHTLEEAGSSGTVGPNLDQIAARPVAHGRPGHQRPGRDAGLSDSLSEQEIADVATYVVESTS